MVPLEAIGAETFETLVSQQGERLIRSLSAIFLDRELAADAAQEAFVQLYLHWDEVVRKGEPGPWLYKVAINRGKDYRRGLARGARLFQRLVDASSGEPGAEDCGPPTEFLSVLSGLPARQRVAAGLYYSADFSVAEIAAVMGISEGSVSSHLHRARVALKQILEST
jgi:RNA polymerase sigma-70 factor, ECF subfamily